ncbi:S-layer protein (TIGR01564 family) [Methanococcus maripaludis]|uniref:S-layer protein (TIGR01564 family) n=1 Tax=Methanococcus maripaludis TaxID=39152 RepID=A0A7J9NJE2_METMI|nr:S-layer protein [Methanococcus maripaludis]MBA2840787.1 S-layer protein (TIGR01564 family) [Methanococcus maripaludis]
MAMSMKKIGAIAVGGAMVASALATGAFAAEKVGDVDAFAADVVADGNANVDIVVGSNAAALDVVSAANIAAKIGSLMFKEGTVEDGAAEISVTAKAESNDVDILDNSVATNIGSQTEALFFAAADNDYTKAFDTDVSATIVKVFDIENSLGVGGAAAAWPAVNLADLGDLSTLVEVDDVDPSDWTLGGVGTSDNAAEMVIARLEMDGLTDFGTAGEAKFDEGDLIYASLVFSDASDSITASPNMAVGITMPVLGQERVLVKADDDDEILYFGSEVFRGVLKEGDSYDIGNGYSVKATSVLKPTTVGATPKAELQVLKDGKVVSSKFDSVPYSLVYGDDVGIYVEDALENVAGEAGYVELVITDNILEMELGEEVIPDWEAYAVGYDGVNDIVLADDFTKAAGAITATGVTVPGIALKYVGDNEDGIDSDKDYDIADYAKLAFDEDGTELNVFFKMDESKDISLNVGQKVSVLNAEVKLSEIAAEAKEAVVMTAPIAVLDSEASLDDADKALILVGGPVVNALTAELADAGLVAMDNESPATLAVAAGAANGNDVLVVAGGDRAATEEAAEALIAML